MNKELIERLRIGQNAGSRVCEEAADALEAADRRIEQLEAVLIRLYNSGYHAGHEDTVEGMYTDVLPSVYERNRELLLEVDAKAIRIEQLEAALESIAANTCCEPCQEAKLVAKQALAAEKGVDMDTYHDDIVAEWLSEALAVEKKDD